MIVSAALGEAAAAIVGSTPPVLLGEAAIALVRAMGLNGAEFFNHPWELGVRKAKEMLFTSESVSAHDAFRLGMINHVVARDELSSFTLALAERIAQKPLFALMLAKESVNAAQDSQGRVNAMQTSFAYHQLGHSHKV